MKLLLLEFFAFALLGWFFGEYLFRIITNDFPDNRKSRLKLLLMLPVYGGGGVLISIVYMVPFLQDIKFLVLVMVLGTIICNAFEFGYGMLFNKLLKLNIWDYSKEKFNIMGQIDLKHTVIWFCITPIAIYFDQIIRWLAR